MSLSFGLFRLLHSMFYVLAEFTSFDYNLSQRFHLSNSLSPRLKKVLLPFARYLGILPTRDCFKIKFQIKVFFPIHTGIESLGPNLHSYKFSREILLFYLVHRPKHEGSFDVFLYRMGFFPPVHICSENTAL